MDPVSSTTYRPGNCFIGSAATPSRHSMPAHSSAAIPSVYCSYMPYINSPKHGTAIKQSALQLIKSA
jgi:hypothetical protein